MNRRSIVALLTALAWLSLVPVAANADEPGIFNTIGVGTRKAWHGVKHGVNRAEHGVKHGVNRAEHGVKHGVNRAEHGVEHGVNRAEHGVEHGASRTEHYVQRQGARVLNDGNGSTESRGRAAEKTGQDLK